MTTDTRNWPAATNLRLMVLLAPFQFIFGLVYSWGAISPAIHVQSAWSLSVLDLEFSLTPLALLPAVVWSGHGLQRFAPKTILGLALTCFTIGGALGLSLHSPLAFMAGYSVLALGIGAGLSTAACIAMVSRFYPERRGVLSGALLALYGMSSVVSAPLFQSLDVHLGWRTALTTLIGLYAALGWIAWAMLPSVASTQKNHADSRIGLWTMLCHRPLRWALALVLLAAPLGSASFATIGHLAHELGFGPSFALIAVAGMAIGNGLGRLGFGALADLYGAHVSRSAVLAVNALAALIVAGALYGRINMPFVSYPLLIGLSFGGMAGKLPGLAAHVVEDGHAETAFGLLFGAFAFASFLGPLTSAVFGMQLALGAFAISAVVAWLLLCFRVAP